MKETGLMFKAPLVRSILAGQKTQTRRVVKSRQGLYPASDNWSIDSIRRNYGDPYGQPGDRIYVRETWCQQGDDDGFLIDNAYWYRATNPDVMDSEDMEKSPWRPSIHMPKHAARIWLEVTGVRVERLQQISDADALAEGVDRTNTSIPGYARERFRALWDSTTGRPSLPANENSKRYDRVKHWLDTHPDTTGWAANPWVWVIDFKNISTTGRPA